MKVFITAGEPSGDKLGAALMAGLKALHPDIAFEGVGGPLMEAEGLRSLYPMDDLTAMGLVEILPKYRFFLRRIDETARAVLAAQPDVLITIDLPEFSLRVARKVKEASALRTVHYVAPSVWAWRPGRAAKMARMIDHVLALLPFEPPLMEAEGMDCDFVGHPIVAEPQATEAEAAAFRAEHGIAPDVPLILTLPGSRRSEITRLAGTFSQTLGLLKARHPDLVAVVPAAGSVADLVKEQMKDLPPGSLILDPRALPPDAALARKRAAFRAADVALAASGTVALELAAAGTPMVVGHDMNWLTRTIMLRMLRVDSITLVNLVSGTTAVPEYLGLDCKPEALAAALEATLADASDQHAAMTLTMERLGRGGEDPGLRAARAVLSRL